MTSSKDSIGIVGTGAIGKWMAMLFTAGGHPVKLFDSDSKQLASAQQEVAVRLDTLEQAGHLRGSLSAREQCDLITTCADNNLAQLAACRLIMECVPEVVEVKRAVFQQLDSIVSDQTLLCSSSSCLVSSQYTAQLKHRANCLVAHPINPPYFLPLVELVPAPWTAPETVNTVRQMFEAIGQTPVVLNKEVDGFAVNRLQYALINASWDLVADGIMTPSDVDKVMTCGLGPRYALYGPFAVMQMNANGMGDYMERYKAGMMRISAKMGDTNRDYDTATEKRITAEMNAVIPTESLDSERKLRDEKLAKLAALKYND